MSKTIHKYREDAAYKKLRQLLKDYDQFLVDDLYTASSFDVKEERLDNLDLDPQTESKVVRLIY